MHSFTIKGGALFSAALVLSNTLLHANGFEEPRRLEDFVVSAGPLARPVEDYARPFASLDEDAIRQGGGDSLGRLLDNQLGVASSGFGLAANRPVIRGLDGPRVRILESGLDSLDVSETSPDHLVSIEPLLTDRIEILRGPSTLLYGSSAIGGVVNAIGKEIPREPVSEKGYEGAWETRYDSVSEGKTHVGYGTVGGPSWAFRVTGLKRKSENYRIPGEAEIHHGDEHDDEHEEHEEDHDEHEEEDGSHGKLDNSFVENDFFSVGGTRFFGDGHYVGAAFSLYEAFYGVPGHAHHNHEDDDEHEEDAGATIDLERKRFDLELALLEPADWIEALRVRIGHTDYEHDESEGDEPGTVFERDGWELRAEAAHYDWGFVNEGVFGLQVSDTQFQAIGEEGGAFGPPSETRNQALFVNESVEGGWWHHEFGGRIEAQQIDVKNEPDYEDIAFGLGSGWIFALDGTDSIALSLQISQRHPTASELYANGAHVATRQFEIGDANLGLETAYGIDLSYRHRTDDRNFTLSLFHTRFEDYIFSEITGEEEDELPVVAYTSVDATFYGAEVELEQWLVDEDDLQVRMGLTGDFVHAKNRETDERLPRIPSLRLGGQLRMAYGDWDAGLRLSHAFDQDKTAPMETATEGYTDLKIDLSRTFDLENEMELTLFARADNLLNEDIRYHTSFIKDLAPQPGRNLTLGGRIEF